MDIEAIYEKKVELFQDVIDKQVSAETSAYAKKMCATRSEKAKAQSEREFKEELAKVRAQRSAAEMRYKKEMSRCEFETLRTIREYRTKIVDEFFEEICADLAAFAVSDKYEGFLSRSIAKAEQELGADIVVFAAKKDLETVKALTKHEVRTDKAIKLGGISAMDEKKGLFVDHTLDSGLADEKQAFTDKKELML